MKIPFEIGNKKFLLEPYRTHQEKDILLASSFDVKDYDRIFEIIGFKYNGYLSDNEKKAILYKYREISIGDEVDVKFKCDNCGQGGEGVLEASNFAIPSKRNDEDVKKLDIPVHDTTLQHFVDFDVDELDIDEFEELKDRVQDNQVTFDFIRTVKCMKCQTEKKFDLSTLDYIIEIMSDDTLMSMYKSYNFLIYFGHHTKEGVDSMYPFERSIFIGLLNKTKEDLTK